MASDAPNAQTDAPRALIEPTHAPPPMRTPRPPGEVVDRLRAASKRGKLPGFLSPAPGARGGAASFRVDVFGQPFDRRLIGCVEALSDGAAVRFRSRLERRTITVVALVLAFTVWPGVVLTHSFLGTWPWYASIFGSWWWTAAWYVPMCGLALPALWAMFRASERAAAEETAVVWTKLAGLLGGSAMERAERRPE